MSEYIVDESGPISFIFKGIEYTSYQRLYSNGDIDVETYPSHDETLDVDGDVHSHAEALWD